MMFKVLDDKYAYNKKNKVIRESFTLRDISTQSIVDRFRNKLEIGNVYTFYIKVRYNIDSFFNIFSSKFDRAPERIFFSMGDFFFH